MQAEQFIKEGKLDDALAALQDAVRSDPASVEKRAFLYQLLCVMGRWDRALTQINVAGELDPKNLLMVELYRNAILCEAFRADVFAGKRTPLMLGEPPAWVGLMVQACSLLESGDAAAAARLRDAAFEAAPAVSGSINGEPFEWIADTDHRLGPILEAVIQGKYYWVPFERIAEITIEPPGALRDVVWAQAEFTWSNEGKAVGLIPVRYPGTMEKGPDEARLSRRTDYEQLEGDYCIGIGQRMWATDAGEYPILETRRITLSAVPEGRADG
ncbi:MAG TPA: tetratricopeptide repeat protein [Phycisphaerales bacterium]|nr:tetratricopeptide repeat protein [Phycisphaerales bacterium]